MRTRGFDSSDRHQFAAIGQWQTACVVSRTPGVRFSLVARVTSPTAEAMRSDRIQSEFKSPVTHHPASRCALRRMPSEAWAEEGTCPRSPIGRGPGLNPGKCGFDARRGYARVAQRQRQRPQTPLSGRSNRPSRTKQTLRSPSGQRHRSYTPTVPGFESSTEHHASLAQGQSAAVTWRRPVDRPHHDAPFAREPEKRRRRPITV